MRAYELDPKGHEWAKNDYDGEVDIFAYNPSEYCNGPLCVKCGYGFCHHCESVPDCKCTADTSSAPTSGTL
jgi:hypothetical protein